MRHVRFNEVDLYFEGQCEACEEWYLLDPEIRHELWPATNRGFRVCRACDNLRARLRMRTRRQNDPAFLLAEKARLRALYESLSPAERRIAKRADVDREDERKERRRADSERRRRAEGAAERALYRTIAGTPEPVVRVVRQRVYVPVHLVTERSYERRHPQGQHWPMPFQAADGRWECRTCGWLLRQYTDTTGRTRLRHYRARRAAA